MSKGREKWRGFRSAASNYIIPARTKPMQVQNEIWGQNNNSEVGMGGGVLLLFDKYIFLVQNV